MSAPPTATIQLPQGPITVQRQDGLLKGRGIRYGHAKRFHRPEPITDSWTEPLDCTSKGPICPQAEFLLKNMLGETFSEERSVSEDCLTLTVIGPEPAPGTRLPVMVWYHGGAYVCGAGDLDIFDTSALAQNGVVVVSVTYRLGLFGYQPIKDIAPANLGLLDQILALQWVHDNVSCFGGDPANVTLFGQSAGGDSVYSLMVAEGTANLFRRSILLSTPLASQLGRKGMEAVADQMAADRITKDNSETLSSEEVIKIQATIRASVTSFNVQGGMCFAPRWGEHPLPPEAQVRKRFVDSTRDKSVIIAWTHDEALPYMARVPTIARLSRIPLLGPHAISFFAGRVTAQIWTTPAIGLRQAINKARGQGATLAFDWFPKDNPFKASHCIDLPFYLGTWDTWKGAPLVHGPDGEEVYARVGREVKQIFTDFAKGEFRPTGHYSVDANFEAKSVRLVKVGQDAAADGVGAAKL